MSSVCRRALELDTWPLTHVCASRLAGEHHLPPNSPLESHLLWDSAEFIMLEPAPENPLLSCHCLGDPTTYVDSDFAAAVKSQLLCP